MPRKAAVPAPEAAPTENNEAAGPPKVCYLDTFLNNNNIPEDVIIELNKSLTRMKSSFIKIKKQ